VDSQRGNGEEVKRQMQDVFGASKLAKSLL